MVIGETVMNVRVIYTIMISIQSDRSLFKSNLKWWMTIINIYSYINNNKYRALFHHNCK
jgi:hypothetical protein